jgi:NAD-dependent SIR2 family protein deacetylase
MMNQLQKVQCSSCGTRFYPVTEAQKRTFKRFCVRCAGQEIANVLNQYIGTNYFVKILEPYMLKYGEQKEAFKITNLTYSKLRAAITKKIDEGKFEEVGVDVQSLIEYCQVRGIKREKDNDFADLAKMITEAKKKAAEAEAKKLEDETDNDEPLVQIKPRDKKE